MIVALLIAAVLFVVQRAMYGVVVTPDGQYYLGMGRGEIVPRPYSLRALPKVIKSQRVWCYVQLVSYFGCVALASFHVEHLGFGYHIQVYAGVAMAVAPILRRTVNWPVLVDAPLLFVCMLSAVLSWYCPPLVFAVVPLSILIHERGPLLTALYAAPMTSDWVDLCILGACVAISAWMTYNNHRHAEPHPHEHSVPWLKNPLRAALAHHAPTLYDPRVWLLPWGGLIVGFLGLSPWGVVTVLVCYGACVVSIDRVRQYQMAVFPVILGLLAIAPDWVLPLVVLTWFTNSKEV